MPFPSQRQLVLPLLTILDQEGGSASPSASADRLGEQLALPLAEVRRTAVVGSAGRVCLWNRQVRWVKQRAKLHGLLAGDRDLWRLTPRGRKALYDAQPGAVITVYETSAGVALWATAEAAVRYIDDGSINLIVTSPMYPIVRAKAYGGMNPNQWVEWMLALAREWKPKLAHDGSLMLNLGDAWQAGEPSLSLYQERLLLGLVDRLGYKLAERIFWKNPSKLPAPAEWVTVRRVRVTPSVEPVLWLAKSAHPKADNRRVLRPYSERMRDRLRRGGEAGVIRPSGHRFAEGAFSTDNGGAIPDNLLDIPNTVSNNAYLKGCRAKGLPPHPARFPEGLVEFLIRLTTEEGDTVYDPFAGSNTTGAVAERLGRHWIASERSLSYLAGSMCRFDSMMEVHPCLASFPA